MRSVLGVVSPAKINLHLRVGPVRSDGFHPLKTWMVTVGLFDTLNFLPQTQDEATNEAGVAIRCADPALPTDDRNLIVRAARLLKAETSDRETGRVMVEVAKAIPMGGGLGGGSSNAAATLIALNALWAMNLSPSRLSTMAGQLGSDVPFFLNGPSAWCSGRGEEISLIAPPACRWAVLILPDFPMPTAAVYQRFDALQTQVPTSFENEDDLSDWSTLPAEELLPRLMNDLERPAFDLRTELAHLRDAAEDLVGRPVRMSGSGSTLFTLFDTKERAEQAEQEIRQRLTPKWGLTALTVRIAP